MSFGVVVVRCFREVEKTPDPGHVPAISSSVPASTIRVPSSCWITLTTLSPGRPNSSVVARACLWFSFVSERVATFRFQEARGFVVSDTRKGAGQDFPLKVEEPILPRWATANGHVVAWCKSGSRAQPLPAGEPVYVADLGNRDRCRDHPATPGSIDSCRVP